MDVAITEFLIASNGIVAQAYCGKDSACISTHVSVYGQEVRVIYQNASHQAFRKSGKAFTSFEEAIEAYKKPEIRAMLQAVAKKIKEGDS